MSIDAQELLDFTKACLRIPSPMGQEKDLAYLMGDWLAARGLQVELIDMVAGRPNLVAVAPGNPTLQSYLLTGHLDAPMPFGQWRRDPWQPWEEDGILYGPGVTDMKGGLCAAAAAAAALSRLPPEQRGDVIFAGVVHHDTHGLGNKFFLATFDRPIDACLSPIPTNMQVQLKVAGACIWELRTEGVFRHISRPDEGINAIDATLEILRRFGTAALTVTRDPDMPFLPHMVTGKIEGGTADSCTAARCTAVGDVRFPPGMTPRGIMADLRAVVAQVLAERPEWKAALRLVRFQMPFAIEADNPLIQAFRQAAAEATGRTPGLTCGLPTGGFITDMADMRSAGIPVVLYGPGDWNTTPDEGCPVADLVDTAKAAYALGRRVLAAPRRGAGR